MTVSTIRNQFKDCSVIDILQLRIYPYLVIHGYPLNLTGEYRKYLWKLFLSCKTVFYAFINIMFD